MYSCHGKVLRPVDVLGHITYEGESISKLQIVIEKNRMEIMTYKQHLFSKHNLHTNLNTCPNVSQVPGNLRRKILLVAVGTTRALLFQPHHRQETVLPKDDVKLVVYIVSTWMYRVKSLLQKSVS